MRLLPVILIVLLQAFSASLRADSLATRKWNIRGMDFYLHNSPNIWNNIKGDWIFKYALRELPAAHPLQTFKYDSVYKAKPVISGGGLALGFVLNRQTPGKFFNSREIRLSFVLTSITSLSYDNPVAEYVNYYVSNDTTYYHAIIFPGLDMISLELTADFLYNRILFRDFAAYGGYKLGVTPVFNESIDYRYYNLWRVSDYWIARDVAGSLIKIKAPIGFIVGVPVGLKWNASCHWNIFAEYASVLRTSIVKDDTDIYRLNHSMQLGIRYKFGRFGTDDDLMDKKDRPFY